MNRDSSEDTPTEGSPKLPNEVLPEATKPEGTPCLKQLLHEALPFLKIPTVAELLALSRAMVYNLIDTKKLERVHPGGAARVTRRSLNRYVEELVQRELDSKQPPTSTTQEDGEDGNRD